MMTVIEKFALGLFVPLRGIQILVRSRTLLRLAVLPFLLTVMVVVTGVAWTFPVMTDWVARFSEWFISLVGLKGGSFGAVAFAWLLPVLTWPVLLAGVLYLLLLVTRVLAAPFYSLLAEKVLMEQGVLQDRGFQLVPWTVAALRMFGISLLRAILLGLIGIFLFILSFVPILGFMTGFCFLILVAFDLSDYSLEAMQLDLGARVRFLRKNILVFFGLGSVMGLVFLLPGLNFFLLPASVVGAADAVSRLISSDQASSDQASSHQVASRK